MALQNALGSQIGEILPEIVEVRHDLHSHPELGYKETRTSGRVRELLSQWGVAHKAGMALGTGVLGFLPATTRDPSSARTVALRADMDALPIAENTGVEYASTTPGLMHACGHDGHTSILLGTTRVLTRCERENNVILVFQPAEEGGAGGERMCQEGALSGAVFPHRVNSIFGLHGYPGGDSGHIYTRNGPLLAAATEFKVVVKGKGAHAAYPHGGIDPVVVSAHVITALQTVASRSIDPLDSVVVTVGHMQAGFAHNVIPETALLHGTLRTLNNGTNEFAKQRIEQIVRNVAAAFGATANLEWIGAYPVTFNDPDATDEVRRVGRNVLGVERVHEEPNPSMGGEDFSFYGREVPASFFFLGLRPSSMERYAGLHSPEFDFNDAALPVGIEVMSALALSSGPQ